MKSIALAAAVGALAVGLASPPSAQARTCFREVAVQLRRPSCGDAGMLDRPASRASNHPPGSHKDDQGRDHRRLFHDDPCPDPDALLSPPERDRRVREQHLYRSNDSVQHRLSAQLCDALWSGKQRKLGLQLLLWQLVAAVVSGQCQQPSGLYRRKRPIYQSSDARMGLLSRSDARSPCNGRAVQHRPASRRIHAAEAVSVRAPRLRFYLPSIGRADREVRGQNRRRFPG